MKPALQSFASVPSTAIFLADRPSCPDHEPQDDQLCSTRSEMVTQKAPGSVTEPASPLGAEYGPLDQTVCDGGEGGGGGDEGGGGESGGGGDGVGGGSDGVGAARVQVRVRQPPPPGV